MIYKGVVSMYGLKRRILAGILILIFVLPLNGSFAVAEGQAEERDNTEVSSWEWVDKNEMLQWSEELHCWGLGIPGASEDNPVTAKQLALLLPAQISARTTDGQTVTADLLWDLSEIPQQGVWSGTYLVTAEVSGEYRMAEDAEPLEVNVEFGGAQVLSELPSGDPQYSDYLVNGVSPNGTTIHLFDYWVNESGGQSASDHSNPSQFQNQGINDDHALLFGQGMDSAYGAWNQWTGNASPRTGIVASKLSDDGYPCLNGLDTSNVNLIKNRDGSESLAYLFDPDRRHKGKQSFEDVQGLLKVDEDGYYTYDCQKNYAVYYQETKSFILYAYPGVRQGGQSPDGQFFPFNAAVNIDTNQKFVNSNLQSTDDSINHYFGLTMSTRFIQQYGGYVDEKHSAPVTYEFGGDDDVWVFIDGTLVADLGGIHNRASLEIDFSTGLIQVNGTNNGYIGRKLRYDSDTLPDNTYHTLDFFYLERGNVDSNMTLKYNLVTIPESSVIKVDQAGDPVTGAEFALYDADDPDQLIATGTTGRDGAFVFIDENDYPITIAQLYAEYGPGQMNGEPDLILRETKVPPGYRSAETAMELRFHESDNGEVLLLSNNQWDTGAYAMSKVTATAPDSIRSEDGTKEVDLKNVTNPQIFAVVFQKQESGDWFPLYGDPISGWSVTDGSSWADIREAAEKNPYFFQLASNGSYQVEVENLPGDITSYYYVCGDEQTAKYTVAYYYTTAGSTEQINGSNTWRIDSDAKESQYQFDRVFSVNLYVPNIKNRLFVQKVDEEKQPVNGAEFSLYRAGDVDVNESGFTIHTGANAYDQLTTAAISGSISLDGGGVFPAENGILECGEYFLIETGVPEWYQGNETAIRIVVDSTGVYADAGDGDDGVSVLRGVGSVVKSMVQFAADDQVDLTLNTIRAGSESGTYTDGTLTWNDDTEWENEETLLHLQYSNQYQVLDYRLEGGSGSEANAINELTVETVSGWSRLSIRQCYQHDGNSDSTLKTDLQNQDLTNLFSGLAVVRVENQKVGSLTVQKEVLGEEAPETASFTFQLSLSDSAGASLTQSYQATRYLTDGRQENMTVKNGDTFQLKDGEKIVILDLPAGAGYQVEETNIPSGFTPSVRQNQDVDAKDENMALGSISHRVQESVTFYNAYSSDAVAVLNGVKRLSGRMIGQEDVFEFQLSAADDATSEAIEAGDVVLGEGSDFVSVTGDGSSETASFSFPEIRFREQGQYCFYIAEVVPAEHPGMTYDTHKTMVTVNVLQDEAGGLMRAVVSYDNTGAPIADDREVTDRASFTNQITGEFSFRKVDRKHQPVEGARFALYRLDCENTDHDHSGENDELLVGADGAFEEAYRYSECWTLIQTEMSAPDTGLVQFSDIPIVGEYRLVEVLVPDGFMNPGGQWKVEYSDLDGKFGPKAGGDASVGNPPAIGVDEEGVYYIFNYRPSALPFAGNKGIVSFMAVGGVIMAAGGTGLLCAIRKRRRLMHRADLD